MKLLMLFAIAVTLRAQTPLTTVTDTIYDGAGQRVTGSCTYRLASGRAVGATGAEVSGEPVTVRFTNGAFSAQIVPTDTMTPSGQYYSASCSGSRGWSKTGNWQVATSGSALKWSDIWLATAPIPGGITIPSTPGTYCLTVAVINGVPTITGLILCTGGGGGGGGLTNGMTWNGQQMSWNSISMTWH